MTTLHRIRILLICSLLMAGLLPGPNAFAETGAADPGSEDSTLLLLERIAVALEDLADSQRRSTVIQLIESREQQLARLQERHDSAMAVEERHASQFRRLHREIETETQDWQDFRQITEAEGYSQDGEAEYLETLERLQDQLGETIVQLEQAQDRRRAIDTEIAHTRARIVALEDSLMAVEGEEEAQ